jgi:hypothetical protein
VLSVELAALSGTELAASGTLVEEWHTCIASSSSSTLVELSVVDKTTTNK